MDIDYQKVLLLKLDAESETAELVEEHVERLGDAGCRHRLALDDSLVGLGSSGDVITLDGDDLLEHM